MVSLSSCHNRYISYSQILLKLEGIRCLESYCTVIAVMSDSDTYQRCVCFQFSPLEDPFSTDDPLPVGPVSTVIELSQQPV